MKKIILLLLVFIFQSCLYAQQPSLLSLDQLEKRIQNGKDTTYVINFWATWCSFCNRELPYFEKLNKEYHSEKLKVLLVSVDFISVYKTKLIPFVKKKQLKSEVFLLNERNQQEYIDRVDKSWSGAIPATLFIKGKNRKFLEQEFEYLDLVKEYQTFKSLP